MSGLAELVMEAISHYIAYGRDGTARSLPFLFFPIFLLVVVALAGILIYFR